MKKNLIRMMSLLLVICLLFLSGCEKPAEEPAKTPEEFWARTHEWNSEQLMYSNANEYGYYYMNDENNLTYFDYATKKSVILCNKVGCKHDDIYCEAYIQGSPFLFFRGEKMYLITSKDDGVHIFQCDLDGTNRESKMLLMKDEMEKGNAVGTNTVLFNGDELYYTAAYQEQGDASQINKNPIKAVRRVDLNSWTEQEICRSVENTYSIIGAETGGVLLLEKPDAWAITDVDWGQISEKDKEQGVVLLTKEQMQKLPVTVFYWDKNTNNKMTVYQSNYAEKSHVTFAEKNYLYCLASPEGLDDLIGLEKVDMRTGQTEWLWKEKAGPESTILDCWKRNNHIYFTVMKKDDACPMEVYTADEFKEIALPFLSSTDTLLFDDEHGYVMLKTIEHQEGDTNGNVVDIIFIPIEEAGKEKPKYTVLYSGERD